MIKKLLSVAVVSVTFSSMLVFSATTAFAESSQKLTDDASLLLDSQADSVEQKLNECTDKTGWDTIIYTNNNGISASNMENYCNDYFDNNNYGCGDEYSGVMLTVDMSSREMYILTKGEAMYYFSDIRMDELLDSVQSELSDGDYIGACEEFVDTVEQYYTVGKYAEGNATYNNVVIVEKELGLFERLIRGLLYGVAFMVVGGGIGTGVAFLIRYNYSKNGKGENYNLAENHSLNLTEKSDAFLYKNVTYTTVSSSSSGSSGGGHRSSSHSSRSSHGGGGRHF